MVHTCFRCSHAEVFPIALTSDPASSSPSQGNMVTFVTWDIFTLHLGPWASTAPIPLFNASTWIRRRLCLETLVWRSQDSGGPDWSTSFLLAGWLPSRTLQYMELDSSLSWSTNWLAGTVMVVKFGINHQYQPVRKTQEWSNPFTCGLHLIASTLSTRGLNLPLPRRYPKY